MTIHSADTVDQLVSESTEAARILSRHGIDFCSEGDRTLKEACSEAGVSLRKLLREISFSEESRKSDADVSTMSIDELTRYIETYHHHYTVENMTFIRSSLSRLVRLYGEEYPELLAIRNTFDELTGPLLVHMQHEEFIVFPYIRQLAKKGRPVRSAMYRSANSPIPGMLTDHEKGAALLRKLDELTNHYQAPQIEGNAIQITYKAIRELEKDLQTHITIENEILFPKALEMEIRVSNLTWSPQH